MVTTTNEPNSREESAASVLFEMDELRDQYTYDEDIQKERLYDRVSSLQIDNRTYAYTYYNNGKLKTVSKDGNLLYYYYYDAAGQLTRTDDSYQNKTYQYIYDSYGNIKTHNTYAYCDNRYGLTTSLISTRSYGYDSTDKNKLISYNGFPVSYDSSAGYYSGNPTSYYGNTIHGQWEISLPAYRETERP